jgi:hypothetical protein
MEEGTTDSLLYIPFNPDRPPEHKTFDLAQDLGMSQNVAQLATHEKRIKTNVHDKNFQHWFFC